MGVSSYIPPFELGNRFCYFLDLYESSIRNKGSLKAAKQNLYKAAITNIVRPAQQQLSLIANQQEQSEVIKSAIDFLQQIAASERNKEIRIINKYINELKNNELLKTKLQSEDTDLDKLLQELQQFSQNPRSEDISKFYPKLILLINTLRNNIEGFVTRLAQLTDKNRRTEQEIRSDFFPLRMASDLDSAFKAMSGVIQREKEGSMSKKIRNLVFDYVAKNLSDNDAFLENPYETVAVLMISFESFLQNELNRIYATTGKKMHLEDLEIDELFKVWEQSEQEIFQRIKNNGEELEELFQTIRTQTGLREVKEGSKEYNRNIKRLEQNRKTETGRARSAANKKLSAIVGQDKLSPKIAWSLETINADGTVSKKRNAHGALYEAIKAALNRRTTKVGGTAAVDIITLDIGSLNLDIDITNQLEEQTKDIVKIIEDYAKETKTDRFDDMYDVLESMNGNIRYITDKMNKLLKENNITEDIFIYHESLKLYTQIETHEKSYFHGRELNILSALDQIYSMNGIEDLILMDKEVMYNIALNLSNLAIGGEIKGDIENYLSIFAGMLMFDDMQNMANDIARNAISQVNTSSGEVRHVHLYLLNDIYVPGSYILTNVALALQEGYSKITAEMGAQVKITTSEIDSEIVSYLSDRIHGYQSYTLVKKNEDGPTEVDTLWNAYGNYAMQGTKIQIVFLSSFFSFLTNIQNYMKNGG